MKLDHYGIESPLLDPDYPNNAKRILGYCATCGEPLTNGDKVIDSDLGRICEDCVYGMSTDELFNLVGTQWHYLNEEEERSELP